MMTETTGGCLCGRVRYTATGEPAFSGICHCRNCQRFTGSAFETTIGFPTSSVSVQGELKTYDEISDAGRAVRRRFCPNCGSGVIAEADAFPGITIFLAGSLDDPNCLQTNNGALLQQRSAVVPPAGSGRNSPRCRPDPQPSEWQN